MKFGNLKVGDLFHRGDEESGRFGRGILVKIPPKAANVRRGFINAREPNGVFGLYVSDETPVIPATPIQNSWRRR